MREGVLINSGEFNGLPHLHAFEKIVAHLESLGAGRKKITYKLRDRSVSRQRYRGSPIPVYYKEPMDMVPFYEYEDAERKHKPGQETLTRQVMQVIVKDKNSDEYCFIKWNHDGDVSGFFGGIEEGETAEQAAERELLEEGGFTSIEVKKHILEYHCKFWHPTKKRNQYSVCTCLYVEVDRNSKQEISKEEQAQHSLVWMSAEEFLKVSNNDTTKYALRILL
ncbi:NUDIX domain-containing protein [Patescibacteria group bacterium]|nr:NUDIX domain-containing protein [Patescibacteria group bacterium]